MNPEREREYLRQGIREESAIEGYGDWLKQLLPEVAPSLGERVIWLMEELVRARTEHHQVCRLAWQLYLAGTSQTEEKHTLPSSLGPVHDVKQAILAAGLHASNEKRNVSGVNTPRPRRNES